MILNYDKDLDVFSSGLTRLFKGSSTKQHLRDINKNADKYEGFFHVILRLLIVNPVLLYLFIIVTSRRISSFSRVYSYNKHYLNKYAYQRCIGIRIISVYRPHNSMYL